jgi:hypothetical protein
MVLNGVSYWGEDLCRLGIREDLFKKSLHLAEDSCIIVLEY